MQWNGQTPCKTVMMIMIVAATYTPSLRSQEQQIRYSSDTRDYSLSYEKARLDGYDMNQLVWLSPWYDPGQSEPFLAVYSVSGTGSEQQVDKFFIAVPLEAGPVQIQRPNEESFKPRAEGNLGRTQRQIRELQDMRVPPVLEPVKQYLLDRLQFSFLVTKLRYEYIDNGNVEPLQRALCERCQCGPEEYNILQRLRNTDDYVQRLTKSFTGWPNEMLSCYKRTHPKYPVAAWDAFLKQFGVTESHVEKSPE